jgi:hypothetical protein
MVIRKMTLPLLMLTTIMAECGGCGCSRSPAPPVKGEASSRTGIDSLASETDAIRRFHAVRGSVGLASTPKERVMARRELLRNCLARVNGTLQPQEKKDCIVFGDLSALDREGECWAIEVDHGLLGGQCAYFDDKGLLLFAWRVPEG